MKLILTMHAAFLTANDIADAVMEYDLALTLAHRVDSVSVPIIDAAETRREAQFTIGWQMGTSTITQPRPTADVLHAVETVRELKARASALGHSTARPLATSDAPIDWPQFDWPQFD